MCIRDRADFGSAVMFFQTMSILLSNPRFSKTLDFLNILITRHTGSVEAKQTEAMIRLAFSPYVLDSVMVQTVEIERAGNDFGTVYDIEPLQNGDIWLGTRKGALRLRWQLVANWRLPK